MSPGPTVLSNLTDVTPSESRAAVPGPSPKTAARIDLSNSRRIRRPGLTLGHRSAEEDKGAHSLLGHREDGLPRVIGEVDPTRRHG
jgi:hypothetical protein